MIFINETDDEVIFFIVILMKYLIMCLNIIIHKMKYYHKPTFLKKFFLVAAGDALRARSENRKCYGRPSVSRAAWCVRTG